MRRAQSSRSSERDRSDSASLISPSTVAQVLLENALLVLDDGDLGDFAGQLGVFVVGLGALGRDLLVDQLILERRRVELADELALLDRRSLGLDHDDRRLPLDQAVGVFVLRSFPGFLFRPP